MHHAKIFGTHSSFTPHSAKHSISESSAVTSLLFVLKPDRSQGNFSFFFFL